MSDLEILRYPIGKFVPKDSYSQEDLAQLTAILEGFPTTLENVVSHFSQDQLDTPYREGGWTVRQLIHHLAESHMHSYIRFKWTLTEDKPVIKAYDEKAWAETHDTKTDPALSLSLLKALHAKWVLLIKGLSAHELQRSFIHPAIQKEIKLERMVALYAWHCQHHLEHITSLKERMKW